MSDKPKPGNVKLTDHPRRRATIFDRDDPPTAEELAEWKKQWEKEWLELTFKNLTPHQKKEFQKRLNPSLATGRAKGAQQNKIRAVERRAMWRRVYFDLTTRGENRAKIVTYILERSFGRMNNGKPYSRRTINAALPKGTKQ